MVDIEQSTAILQDQIELLLERVSQNEQKHRRFQDLEMRLLGVHSLRELVQTVLEDCRATNRLDHVSLVVVDPEHEFRRLLEQEGFVPGDTPAVIFEDSSKRLKQLYGKNAVVLGSYEAERHAWLFPLENQVPSSIALMALRRHGEIIGSLQFGSDDLQRYSKDLDSFFIDRLGAIVAVCVENAINHARVKQTGLTDTLTAVNNRRFFDQRLGEELDRAKRGQQPLSCLFLDIDFFKKINDGFGHHAGDLVLSAVAGIIHRELRNNDVLARYGGEEFVALLSNTDAVTAMEVAERIRRCIERKTLTTPNGDAINVTISIGAATLFPENSSQRGLFDGDGLVETADRALYEAKHSGRNCVISANIPRALDLASGQ